MKKTIKSASVLVASIFFIISLFYSDEVKTGVYNGLILCSSSVIPSLFLTSLLSVFVCNMLKANLKGKLGISVLFLLSVAGGYPVGAKLLREYVNSGKIKKEDAKKLINVCYSSGPAFIVAFVGGQLFYSVKLGLYLLLSQTIASVMLFLFFSKNTDMKMGNATDTASVIEVLTDSVSKTTESMITICVWIIVFSGVIKLIKLLLPFGFVETTTSVFEVTNGLVNSENIFISSAILSFGGISTHFQIISIADNYRINYKKFLLSRAFHITISELLLKIILTLTKAALPVSNFEMANIHTDFVNPISVICLFICLLTLLYTFSEKNVEKFI